MFIKSLSNIAVVLWLGGSGGGANTLLSPFQISHSAYLATEPDNLKVCRESLDHLVLPASRVHLIH